MATQQEVADEFSVTLDQVKQLKNGMEITWDQIRYEVDPCWYETEAEMVAESTIDGGQLIESARIRGLKTDWSFVYNHSKAIELAEETWKATTS